MQPHQQRVVEEERELSAKRDKLAEFINAPAETSIFAKLSADEQKRLYRQLSAMNEYAQILSERISAFD